jgi:hypothetical protein
MRISKRTFGISGIFLIILVIAISLSIVVKHNYQESGHGGKTYHVSPIPSKAYYTPPTGGKAYYVSPTGDDTNDGSEAHPFATIQKAAEVVTPGTTVYVSPGTYTQPITVTTDGTADARITFFSEVQWGAKIKTTGAQASWITQADYIDIVGFDVSSTDGRGGIENFGSFIRTIGNHVHNVPSKCDSDGGDGIGDDDFHAHDNDIIGNVVDHIGASYPKLCEYVHGIYHSNARGHILNNIVYDNAGCGINLWHAATDTVVDNNLSFGNQAHGISIGTDTDDTNNVLGDHFIVANNISIYNARLGIRERVGVGPHNQYLNNIVYGNGFFPFGGERYDNQHSDWPSMAGSKDLHTITQNAEFVDYEADGSGDYHLQASSPAIDAGTSIGAPSTDFDGKPRPQDKGIDIGPYEYA